MQPYSPKERDSPEGRIQKAIVKMLNDRNWFTMVTHGNAHQKGFPDIYAVHRTYGHRWIECKNPDSYSFTRAQQITFPQFTCNGSGVWILIAPTEVEYRKLFELPNWHHYLSIINLRGKSRMPETQNKKRP